jgi:2-phosphosulfolactate phosphatase
VPSGSLRFISHPRFLRPADLAGAAVAVIDLLRATTTITAALAAGAGSVVPCATVAEARSRAARLRTAGVRVVLAGERGGLRVPGFDLGNSPREMRGSAAGARVVLATTNGTRALAASGRASWVAAVCLNNLSAAATALARRPEPRKVVVAAGEGSGWSEEDGLAAGLLLRDLVRRNGRIQDLDRPARAVWALTSGVKPERMADRLLATPHGQDLRRLGFARDVRDCARLDTTGVVGVLGPDRALHAGPGRREKHA